MIHKINKTDGHKKGVGYKGDNTMSSFEKLKYDDVKIKIVTGATKDTRGKDGQLCESIMSFKASVVTEMQDGDIFIPVTDKGERIYKKPIAYKFINYTKSIDPKHPEKWSYAINCERVELCE